MNCAHETPEICSVLSGVKVDQHLLPGAPAEFGAFAAASDLPAADMSIATANETRVLSLALLHKLIAHIRAVYSVTSPEQVPACPSMANCLDMPILHAIFAGASQSIRDCKNIVHVSPEPWPEGTDVTTLPEPRVVVIGDIHGCGHSVAAILESNGLPSPQNKYVFNGDFVDRGPCSVEVIAVICLLLTLFPEHVVAVRGNHETLECTRRYGFFMELYYKLFHQFAMELYNHTKTSTVAKPAQFNPLDVTRVFCHCLSVFAALPIGAVVSEKVLVTHGGLALQRRSADGQQVAGPGDTLSLAEIDKLDRHTEPARVRPDTLAVRSLLWSDPVLGNPCPMFSIRGRGRPVFGAGAVVEFLKSENLLYMVRSHEMPPDGYLASYGGRLHTIFSFPQRFLASANGFLSLAVDRFRQYGHAPSGHSLRMPAPQLCAVSAHQTTATLSKAVEESEEELPESLTEWLHWLEGAHVTEHRRALQVTASASPVSREEPRKTSSGRFALEERVEIADAPSAGIRFPPKHTEPGELSLDRHGLRYGPLDPDTHFSVLRLRRPYTYNGEDGDGTREFGNVIEDWPLPREIVDEATLPVLFENVTPRPDPREDALRFCRASFMHIHKDASYVVYAF